MASRPAITFLDGAVGTELERRGVATAGPAWSARAVVEAPEVLTSVHAEYARAGATVHTAATFRTTPRAFGPGWDDAARRAIALARAAVHPEHRVAASLAPLEDCWRPDLSPPDPGPEHRAIARVLAGAGADLILCETFAHVGEAVAAVEAAVATGCETWLALTAGPFEPLLSPAALRVGARRAVDAGAAAVLVNCVPAVDTLAHVEALLGLGVPVGAYANAGHDAIVPPEAYAAFAERWLAAGATIVGGCCGTGPAHVAALVRAARSNTDAPCG